GHGPPYDHSFDGPIRQTNGGSSDFGDGRWVDSRVTSIVVVDTCSLPPSTRNDVRWMRFSAAPFASPMASAILRSASGLPVCGAALSHRANAGSVKAGATQTSDSIAPCSIFAAGPPGWTSYVVV